MDDNLKAYQLSQKALANIKYSILIVLAENKAPMKNADLGRKLGLYHGHKGHKGHITRTILELMKADGVVQQIEDTKEWFLLSRYANTEQKRCVIINSDGEHKCSECKKALRVDGNVIDPNDWSSCPSCKGIFSGPPVVK